MASKVVFVTLPAPLAARVEELRASRAVGGAKPPAAAIVRALVERGLDVVAVDHVGAPAQGPRT
jgi:hypothetical protein